MKEPGVDQRLEHRRHDPAVALGRLGVLADQGMEPARGIEQWLGLTYHCVQTSVVSHETASLRYRRQSIESPF
ncbi:MAG TPA: hypothetical protein VFP84_27685 [Kofleriaceae bacterium]|nr:hypothetical protein [Kofleriaceae bacterium]